MHLCDYQAMGNVGCRKALHKQTLGAAQETAVGNEEMHIHKTHSTPLVTHAEYLLDDEAHL